MTADDPSNDEPAAGRSGEPRGAAFYGRRKGKKLRTAQAAHLAQDLPRLAIALDDIGEAPLTALFAGPVRAVRLEIGFGGGEHLLAEARRHPDIGYIGAEAFLNGIAKATARVSEEGLANVRLYGDDVVPLLDRLPGGSLERIDLLYPDPWPKRRHWKRRFVRGDNIDRFARLLAPGGHFRFATDIEHYAAWTLRLLLADPRFEWTAARADDWRLPWEGWPGTRYEAKALREGRRPGYYEFQRR
ncbi:tRNA (guanine(46)-N(7))-methyltransferase TrmB [Ancylobacter dichloromethanicus]|uniref:tRNA (guanine-N(7)-)-methyltransferase n=1 Tax=Ancylobacter dichloromethanicus TaxID=518825 RepID=A0A9W6J8Z5_9HYPH|nr:tRNA (guanine(46)-N(7))-methyltransferase TrmB [Ancylobacter dichloromethanicus]MBS7552568.1 tRNA (guanine(46)-N(7))-methyltransferase TrmB [Ancylobacter dichloromethanicus]GLK71928.1 tRNA (guanine-N(7)-)-methyltransferase [Ancylobacter dichloromethanicus]